MRICVRAFVPSVLVMIRLRHEITLGLFSDAYEIHKARQILPTFVVPFHSCNFN